MVLGVVPRVMAIDLRHHKLPSPYERKVKKQGTNIRKRTLLLRKERLPSSSNTLAGNPSTPSDKWEGSKLDDTYPVCQQMPSGKLAQSPKPIAIKKGTIQPKEGIRVLT